jgi:hypothetical protein
MKHYKEILIPRQSDTEWLIEVVDDNGDPVNLTQFNPDGIGFESNIVLVLYHPDKTIVDKYSLKQPATGWKELTITGDDNNKLSFLLDSDASNLAKLSKVFYELRVQKEDGNMTDNEFDSIVKDIYLCTITDSITSTLTLP